MKQSLFLCLFVFALATLAYAIDIPNDPPTDPPLTTGMALLNDLPPTMDATETTRTVIGDLTGDLRPDACMLCSGTAYLAFGPNCFPAIEQIPAEVIALPIRDIEFLPRAGGPGALLCLTDNGIEVVSAGPIGFVHEESIANNLWQWAQALRVLDYNGDGNPDVVGISGNRLRLLRIGDFNGNRVFENDAAGSDPIHEIEPLDWNNDGKDEVAVRLDDRVEIHVQVPWSMIIPYNMQETPALLQAVEFQDEGDRLAVITWAGGGLSQALHLLDQNGNDFITGLGYANITAMDSGDTNGDGYGDLVLVRKTNYFMGYLLNRYLADSDQPFKIDAESAFILPASVSPAVDNRAEPVLADLDNDGDLDLTVVLGDDQKLLVQRNTNVPEHLSWVRLSDNPLKTKLTFFSAYPAATKTLHMLVIKPTNDMIGMNRMTHIEIRVWRQDNITAPAILYGETQTLYVSQEFTSQDITFNINEPTNPPFDAVYTFEFRPVVKVAETITDAGPTNFFFYTTKEDDFCELILFGPALPNNTGTWKKPFIDEENHYGGLGPAPNGPGGTGGFGTPPVF